MRFVASIILFFILPGIFVYADDLSSGVSKGDEISGEANVSWKAVVKKITSGNSQQPTVIRASVIFSGQTTRGNQIRGTGKMRFVGSRSIDLNTGDVLQSEGLLDYWATVTSVLGKDLVLIGGIGLLDFPMNTGMPFKQAVIEVKGAIDIEN